MIFPVSLKFRKQRKKEGEVEGPSMRALAGRRVSSKSPLVARPGAIHGGEPHKSSYLRLSVYI